MTWNKIAETRMQLDNVTLFCINHQYLKIYSMIFFSVVVHSITIHDYQAPRIAWSLTFKIIRQLDLNCAM